MDSDVHTVKRVRRAANVTGEPLVRRSDGGQVSASDE